MLCCVYGMYRKTRHFMVANQIHVPRTRIRNRYNFKLSRVMGTKL